MTTPAKTSMQATLLAHVQVDSKQGCWLWMRGRTAHGYGLVTVGVKRQAYTHRVAWEAWRGPIPPGLHVLHRCDNPPCVNPDHLFIGTRSDNMQDMVAKRRAGAWTKPNRVARGERAGPAKLTEAQARSILARTAEGALASELAEEFKVTAATVRMIARGRTWSHLRREAA